MDKKKAELKKSQITMELASVAMGHKPGDIIIKGGKLVNVLTSCIEENIDVIIYKGFIALVGDATNHPVGTDTAVIDAKGKYIMPGLVDSHMHVESSMIDLVSFAAAVLPHGTTTICPDNHEMTNVLGLKAVELFKKTAENLPLNVYPAMPVCVPSIPGMEDAGASIGSQEVDKAYSEGWAELQGEQMNFPGVIFSDPHVHAITGQGINHDRVLTGHYASPDLNSGLNAFIASGMTACHESTAADEALIKASRGMYVQMRYGTAWLDLPNLVPSFLDKPDIDTRMFAMVTDDVTPSTIAEEGHLVRVLRKAVSLGVPPLKAIQMVTINAAQLLEKSRIIGSVSPGKYADILLVDNLEEFKMNRVISNGISVAENGVLTYKPDLYDYPQWALNTVHINEQSAADFKIASPAGKDDSDIKVRVIRLIPGMVYTKEEIHTMKASDGKIEADPGRDIAKLAVIYRHENEVSEEHKKGLGFVTGLTLKPGCAYASTVSHDCHNLLVAGTDDNAMALAVNTLKQSGGGLAVVIDNRVEALMPLPFAGLMSLKSVEDASSELKNVENAIKKAGCPHDSVEMTISLLGLIVLGDLHLSNRGYVQLKDGNPPEFVSLFSDE